ncbi:hypothetical protein EK21DRAFT_65935 [Setomelanomma holmii]|uniref:Uncharacterized protein n=1 Tax=Setomelanomma holmii TaxID=210430 RepID=A0A9P4H8T5_9PLEO|nr:hypothetical protein EK21DRAFT_65935 [Setomelanomma holmii]
MRTTARGHSGRIASLVPCLLILLLCIVVHGWRASPLLAVWVAATITRWYFGDRQVLTDCIIFGNLNVLMARETFLETLMQSLGARDPNVSAGLWRLIWRIAMPLALLVLLWRYRAYTNGKNLSAPKAAKGRRPPPTSSPELLTDWTSGYPRPRIFPCQTKHARLFPKRHAFEYSYLQVGFPIIPAGVTAGGECLGSGSDHQLGRWWMRIDAEDYLSRGKRELGFYGKLKLYLKEHQVVDSEWSYAYLVTAPRFFGYAFNPVSFWYIYDANHQLQKMILEVNNTFGERRMYLLDGSNVLSVPSTIDSEASGPELPPGAKSRFTERWEKDFHVSPFNSRKGSYVLKALNPFPDPAYDSPNIDNTITLISSKDHAKLVARLNSIGPAMEMDQMEVHDVARFILSWWWVGFVTVPRIIREAFKLFFKRQLHVWFRPEVLHTGIGRMPTSTERELYHVFKDYLTAAVHQSSQPICITFTTAVPDEPVHKIEEPVRLHQSYIAKELEIRILTPAFYSRFVHYAHTFEAFDRECIFTDEKNRTLWVSRPELLPLLVHKPIAPEVRNGSTQGRTYLDELHWSLCRKLRCAPATPAYPVSTPSKVEYTVEDVRSLPFSELDQYVRSICDPERAAAYRRTVTKLFLAQRFTLGLPEIIGALDMSMRLLMCGLATVYLAALRVRYGRADITGCSTKMTRDRTLRACGAGVIAPHGEWWWLVGSAISISACHWYGMLKGYN